MHVHVHVHGAKPTKTCVFFWPLERLGHLFERIMWEAFESENIDGADEVARRTAEHERRIDRFDEHIEEPRVERLPQVVPSIVLPRVLRVSDMAPWITHP